MLKENEKCCGSVREKVLSAGELERLEGGTDSLAALERHVAFQ